MKIYGENPNLFKMGTNIRHFACSIVANGTKLPSVHCHQVKWLTAWQGSWRGINNMWLRHIVTLYVHSLSCTMNQLQEG